MTAPTPSPHRRVLLLAAGAGLATLAGCSKNEAPAVATAAGAASAAGGGSPREAFETASRGTGFVVGQAMAARTLLVFFDPQCPHCAALWNATKPLRDRVRMVWMPVAFIAPSSGPQGAMLLAAENGTALMDQHESLLAAGRGGLTAMGADEALMAKVKANTALWRSLDATSVPHLVYRAGASGPYGVQPGGLPTDELAKVLGL
jgi:thiol:disulfide interchange protein DsbG